METTDQPTNQPTDQPTDRPAAPGRTRSGGSDRLAIVPRRTVLATGVAGAAALGVAATGAATAAGAPRGRRSVGGRDAGELFAHGVASGDPRPTAVVLWTRLTPTPDATPGSGRGSRARVTWQVATDEGFRDVVSQGTVVTSASRDHTVKVLAHGLAPARWYHYRFLHRGVPSRTGRTRTAPAHDAEVAGLRLGVVSCANLQAGWFSAYRHLARRTDLDAVLHLGDYLYEYAPGEYGMGHDNADVRSHEPAREMVSLADYRRRHAQYKADADLQDLHASAPMIVTWDDHEVTNDQWAGGAENHQPSEGDYLARRARAHRAYDEWMPALLEGTARLDDGTRLHRRLRFGRLAEVSMLDLRTYRSQQVGGVPVPVPNPDPATADPDRTILGDQQMAWLKESLDQERAQWKLVGNPVMIAPVTFAQVPRDLLDPVNDVTGLLPADGAPYNTDQWDGYTADRRELLSHIRDHGVKDAVFLTGDIHSGWACELPHDVATAPVSDSAGVEFVCTSVTSNNLKDITGNPPRTTSLAVEEIIKANNRHIKYLDFDSHGYSVLDVTPARTQMDWYVISARDDQRATSRWSASYRTLAGTGRVERADAPVGGR